MDSTKSTEHTVTESAQVKEKHPIRVWVDGCFDLVHFGHANALRQAKQLGDCLIVGVHNDEEVTKNKGPPVFTEQERYKMVRAIKWVDEVVVDAPYTTYLETLEKHNCDFCAHGDDITQTADGLDSYHIVKSAGKYREFKRTEGISTTDLVGRMLLLTRSHHTESNSGCDTDRVRSLSLDSGARSPWTRAHTFLPNVSRIVEFSEGREPAAHEHVVYVAGAFDLFHVGHVDFLQKIKQQFDHSFVIVGLHSDMIVNHYRGQNHPIMNIHERLLSVLACRYVDNVVIDAPYSVTADLIKHFNVSLVCHGETDVAKDPDTGEDPYSVPKQLGIFRVVSSGNDLTTSDIIHRIIEHRLAFEERNRKKEEKELRAIAAMQAKAN